MADKKCLRSICDTYKDNRCCLECEDNGTKCMKPGCKYDDDNLDLKNCSE